MKVSLQTIFICIGLYSVSAIAEPSQQQIIDAQAGLGMYAADTYHASDFNTPDQGMLDFLARQKKLIYQNQARINQYAARVEQAKIAEANQRKQEQLARERAPFVAKNICDSGNMNMCYNAGYSYEGHYVNLNGVNIFLGVDYFKAAEFYSKACKGGMMKGCAALGNLYKNGKGVTQNNDKAAELYLKACNANEPTGCNNLGTLYQSGYGHFWDKAKVKDLYQKACQLHFQEGCENYAKVNK